MNIALEFNSVLTNRYSGFFTYGRGLLDGFASLPNPPQITLFYTNKVAKNIAWLDQLPKQSHITLQTTRLKARHLGQWWRKVNFPPLQRFTGPFDLYHCNHHLMAPAKGKPRLLTVHDLRRYRFPHFYPNSKLAPFEYAVKTADHFIAISHATKNDLCEFFNIDPNKIDVVYHGGPMINQSQTADIDSADAHPLLKQFNLKPQQYFLVFSSYDKRKNIPNTIKAFNIALSRLPSDYRLVIIGELPNDQIATIKTNRNIVTTGQLSDFIPLLSHATALAYVSLYEGFGLPILEAMYVNTPVVTSNISSMPEVASDAAILVDPQDPQQIAKAMINLATDNNLRNAIITRGYARAQQFSWTRAASETLNVYKKLIRG